MPSLEPDLAAVRSLVFDTFAAEGRPPSVGEIARRLGRPLNEVRADLAELHERHLLVLAPDGDAIRIAHPFSAAPMGFVVTAGDERWWGGCTWDSMGIAAALRREVEIDTRCPECLARLRFVAGPDRRPDAELTVRIPLPAAEWWHDIVWTCARIRSFCSPDHAQTWATRQGEPIGELIPLEQVWRLALPWYGDRLSPEYAPRTREQSQAILSSVGLDGDFWRLP